jgi:hypothetical protein
LSLLFCACLCIDEQLQYDTFDHAFKHLYPTTYTANKGKRGDKGRPHTPQDRRFDPKLFWRGTPFAHILAQVPLQGSQCPLKVGA